MNSCVRAITVLRAVGKKGNSLPWWLMSWKAESGYVKHCCDGDCFLYVLCNGVVKENDRGIYVHDEAEAEGSVVSGCYVMAR